MKLTYRLKVNFSVALSIMRGIRNWYAPFLYRFGLRSFNVITFTNGDRITIDGRRVTLSNLQWILCLRENLPSSKIGYQEDGRIVITLPSGLKFVADEFTLETTLKTIDEQFGLDLYRVKDVSLKGKTVVDIGANIGDSSILFASKGATVYAFEPVPRSYRNLLENVTLNDFQDKIFAFNVGLGAEEKEIKMGISADSLIGFSVIQPSSSPPTAFETIRIVEAISFMKEKGITSCDFLKIDCEGCENALLSDSSLLDFLKPERAIVEWHFGNRAGVVEKLRAHYSEIVQVPISESGDNGLVYAHGLLT